MYQSTHLSTTQEKSRASAHSFNNSENNSLKGKSLYRSNPLFPDISTFQKKTAQLALRSRKDFEARLKEKEDQNDDLISIANKLDFYNKIEPSKDLQFQRRLGQLKSLEESVYAWFANHSTRNTDSVSNALFLKTFLDEIKTEHQSLITTIASTPDALPIDVRGMGKKEKAKVRRIWNDLLKNKGNLQIRDDGKGFRERMLAAFAKLLEGEFGRDMLGDLNKKRGGVDQKIIVGSDFSKELGDDEKNVSEAIPRSSLVKKTEKENDLHGSSEAGKKTDIPEFTKKGEDFSPEEFHDFLISNDKQDEFKWGDDGYKKGKGTGSLVRIAGENDYNIGLNEEQILTPEYITLGHELGHAQRILRGAPLHGMDLQDMGVTDEVEQKLWNNPEEYVNINAVENNLRGEHNLSKRKYHAGDQHTLKFERNKETFKNQLIDFRATLTPPVSILFEFHPIGAKFINYFTEKPDFGSAKVMNGIKKDMERIKSDTNSIPFMWQRAGTYLKSENGQMNGVFASKMTNLLPHITDEMMPNLAPDIIHAMLKHSVNTSNWVLAGKIILWMRAKSNFAPMKSQIKIIASKGGLIPLFQAGLTHEEFEKELDPNLEINVEIEYRKTDPKAWFFKTVEVIYVRKRMRK